MVPHASKWSFFFISSCSTFFKACVPYNRVNPGLVRVFVAQLLTLYARFLLVMIKIIIEVCYIYEENNNSK